MADCCLLFTRGRHEFANDDSELPKFRKFRKFGTTLSHQVIVLAGVEGNMSQRYLLIAFDLKGHLYNDFDAYLAGSYEWRGIW